MSASPVRPARTIPVSLFMQPPFSRCRQLVLGTTRRPGDQIPMGGTHSRVPPIEAAYGVRETTNSEAGSVGSVFVNSDRN
jgi:hypothetical protein